MTATDQTADIKTVMQLSDELTTWLLEKALPVWSTVGANHKAGECYEAISLDDTKAITSPRRARVVPRQIYSFLEGANLGWGGPARDLAKGLFDWHVDRFLTDDGYFAAAVDMDNRITDRSFDLYNQAFALFAFAQIAAHVPECRIAAVDQAANLVNHLFDNYRHPEGGFREANPDKAPLCSNPHMHLFEACLAWEEVSDDPAWQELSDEIAELALTRFIDPVNGGLREFFDLDWSPMPGEKGRVMEPGHQFEWAWLLTRWGRSRGDAGALVAARRLYDIGWTYGIDESRGAAFMALNEDFTVRDPVARLWGQTEWIKAAVALAQISIGAEQEAYLSDIPDAVRALQLYFEDVPDGLWRDKLRPDGSFIDEPAPASSLYHIVCAISDLNAFARTL
ncbi:AGE family epimerase/isomerase [Roseibium salinum]|uniref:AGE family epimerase/isomerase n=1 Tax=Roseibium salinum TaxID=1604349 RepID=A0ABT3R1A2_9HYPH|nr:AGE family epimerase/isomerase [Roseibium sp. DSM 29163]MCX2722989.1 AGE family epimerase/isomerase [Roseibium sp. DSM 29163]